MLKMMGLGLVFLAFAGTGFGMARGLETELITAQELLLLVRRIGSEIRCYKRPLPDILADFESEHLMDFIKAMRNANVQEAFSHLSADPAVIKICRPFFEGVGRCSAEECDRMENECALQLGELIEEMRQAVGQKMKVYRSLGLAGAVAAVILLI